MPLWVHPDEAEESVEFLSKIDAWGELEKIVLGEKGGDEFQSFDMMLYYGAIYGALKMPQKKKCKIPGTLVKKQGIDYCIHGLMHTKERIPYVHKKFSKIKKVVCETNLKSLFGLSSLVDQSRIDECKYVPIIDTAKALGVVYGVSLLSWTLSKLQGKEKMERTKADWGTMVNEVERLVMMIGDVPVYVDDIRLPERLEHTYIECCVRDNYFRKFCTLRSLSHAEFIEKFAKKNHLKEAHGIYGLMHEPEIAYFLRYPEKAEEIKDRFRWKGSPSILPFFW